MKQEPLRPARLPTRGEQIALENKNDLLTDANDILYDIFGVIKSIVYACIAGTILGGCVVGMMITCKYIVHAVPAAWVIGFLGMTLFFAFAFRRLAS